MSTRSGAPPIQSPPTDSPWPCPDSHPSLPPKAKPWLLVGVGNPGKKYHGTRRNVGFEMLNAIGEAEGISVTTVQFKALFGKGRIGNVFELLAKPQTYMNVSGESVGPLVSYFKVPLNQVLVALEDHLGKWILPALFCDHFNRPERGELDFTMLTGLEAVKLLLLDGFDKSATFVNSRKSTLKMGND